MHSSFRSRGFGLDLHVLSWAPDRPRKETIVLLHGYMDAAATWDLCAPALVAAGYRVLAPDLRGYGSSDRVPVGGYYHFPDYIADVSRVLDEHAPGPVFLVGHSMGGTVATLYAGTRPDRVQKLALLEGMGPPDNPPDAAPLRMKRWLDDLERHRAPKTQELFARPMSEEEALARLQSNHPRVPESLLRSRLMHLAAPVEGGLAWRFDPLHRTTSPMPFYAKTFEAFAHAVTCPVLYVSGGKVGYRPPDETERLAAFRSVRAVDLEDAGHMMHWTAPEELTRLLLEHFKD